MSKKQKRKILLLEPNYKNKYPPIGLMKIATYHRTLGDEVTFFKGELSDFVLNNIVPECIERLLKIDSSQNWRIAYDDIKDFISKRYLTLFDGNLFEGSPNEPLLRSALEYYRNYFLRDHFYEHNKFDRIYVTTLFTFYFDITVRTINEAKRLVKEEKELKVGGVAASLIPELIKEATGIAPMTGLLDKPGLLDKGNKMIVDELPLDYSILYEIDYDYPTGSAYFTFMTKGCTRKCSFCAVPKLEPIYKPKVDSIDKFNSIKEKFGDQKNLLLMDNNVLASPKFAEVIQEIKDLGFVKGATYKEPNQLDIAVQNLKNNWNDKSYIRRVHKLLNNLYIPQFANNKSQRRQLYKEVLEKYELTNVHTVTKENILEAYPQIADIYEKNRPKRSGKRYVDFNQGTDCRYVTDEFMKLMSEIPIKPLRIAFDYIGLKKQYTKAVELAAKYGIKELSNYILYNFTDKPIDFYNRLKINVELGERLGLNIYSFPMKYIPLYGEDATRRTYTGKHWNYQYVRAIRSVLNVTRGIVAPKRSFFEKAFGKNEEEFFKILYMPVNYIVYRKIFEELGLTQKWEKAFYEELSEEEREEAKAIIEVGDFKDLKDKTQNVKVHDLLVHYTTTSTDIDKKDPELLTLKKRFEKMIDEDIFKNLTLTYDFE